MRVYLIGYMGCGKSSVGKKLAAKLSFPFIDLDAEIERTAGQTVSELFNSEGEEAFRILEAKILRNIKEDNVVIATGGGCPIFEQNMGWMNENGTTVYLEMTAKAAYSRLVSAKSKRPLIANLDNEEMMGFINDQLSDRTEVYSQAQVKMPAINLDLKALVTQIVTIQSSIELPSAKLTPSSPLARTPLSHERGESST